MIGNFCPFLKEKCKGNECVMWKSEECILVSFLERVQESFSLPPEEMLLPKEKVESGSMILHREEAKVPDWLKTRTPEELAVEMIDFIKKEFSEDEGYSYHTAFRYFWESKGVQDFLLPSEARLKIQRAEFLAERELIKESESERKRKLQEQKDELPSLVSQCVDWARANGLKKITFADLDTFLLEKDIDLLHEIKRTLYSMVNLKLKTKR
jgi:hypothetical protein